ACRQPTAGLAAGIVHQCYLHGLACIHPIGMFGNVIRVAPPLVITEQQVGESLDIFEDSLKAALADNG
ncbi:MAG: 4-aminobutyrate--2-oxoglutarate transaminase, partial [Armatimonadetes bacterium]|nr:4-aminobutyrate--2-oxoglutarate transaminase [Armatimonadota bacterium]